MPRSKIKLNNLLKKQDPTQLSFAIMDIICKHFGINATNKISNIEDFNLAFIEIYQSPKLPSLQQIKELQQDTLQALTIKLSDCCKEIISVLNEKKGNQKVLLLEKNINICIEYFVKKFSDFIVNLVLMGNVEQTKLTKIIQISILDTILFLQDNCQVVNGLKLQSKDWKDDIDNGYLVLAALCLDLDELDNARDYLVKCKQAMNNLLDDAIRMKAHYWQAFYFLKTKLAFKEGNFFAIKKYLLIGQSEIEKSTSPQIINSQQLGFYKEIMLKKWLEADYPEALFWAKALKFGHKKNLEIYNHSYNESVAKVKQLIENNVGKIKELEDEINRIKDEIKKTKDEINRTKDYIHKIKTKIFKDKLVLLNAFSMADIEFIGDITVINNKKSFAVTMKVLNESVTALYKLLKLNNVLCAYVDGTILLTNLVYANVKKIKYSLIEWQNFTERKAIEREKNQSPPLSQNIYSHTAYESECVAETKSNADLVMQPGSKINLASKEPKKKLTETKISNKNNTNISEANITEVSVKTKVIIKWNDDLPIYDENNLDKEVYKIHGLALNHYCFIKSALFDDVCENNPLAAQDLLNMCEYAKAIGNSQKAKGFIIKPNGIEEGNETFDAKLKNSSKDYRFFGHIVAATKTENGKTCQLLAIDSWQETHKSPVKIFK